MGIKIHKKILGKFTRKIINFPSLPIVREIEKNEFKFFVKTHKNGKNEWSLEIIDEQGGSTVWCDLFPSAQDALNEGIRAIKDDGIGSFISDSKA